MAALRLSVVASEDVIPEPEDGLKVAFASGDRKLIDQHFGSAVCFVMCRVTETDHAFIEAVRFPPEQHDGNEDKLQERIEALDGCAAVYVQAVGSSAIRRLLAMGVQPIQVPAGQPIQTALSGLKTEIQARQTPWIVRTLHSGKDPSRFDTMSAEEWNE